MFNIKSMKYQNIKVLVVLIILVLIILLFVILFFITFESVRRDSIHTYHLLVRVLQTNTRACPIQLPFSKPLHMNLLLTNLNKDSSNNAR